MKIFNFKNVFWGLLFLLLAAALFKNSYSYLDPDFGWHLQVGKDIVQTGHVPTFDKYDFPLQGKTWVDHEWLMNMTTYWLYAHLGYLGTNIFFLFIVLALSLIMLIFVQKYSPFTKDKRFLAMSLWLAGAFASSAHLGVRMQEITVLNLALLLILIHFYDRTGKRLLLWLLPPLFYFWSSLHAGFLIGLVTLFLWPAVKIVDGYVHKFSRRNIYPQPQKSETKKIFAFSTFAVGSFLVTFLTPYGTELYRFLSDYKNTYYTTHIGEWLPSYSYPVNYWQMLYLSVVLAGVILPLFFILHAKANASAIDDTHTKDAFRLIPFTLWEMALLLLFTLLTIKFRRNFPLFFVATFTLTVKSYSILFAGSRLPDRLRVRGAFAFLKIFSVILLVLLIASIIFSETKYTADPFRAYCNSYPCAAVQFLKAHKEYASYNLFNSYGWGGYLIWAWPEKKLFIDGRLPQYPLGGKSYLEEYNDFYKKDEVEKKLAEYDIKAVLLKRKHPLSFSQVERYLFDVNEINKQAMTDYLVDYLSASPSWEQVYQDNLSAIYVKKS